jgi:hypothetical protein
MKEFTYYMQLTGAIISTLGLALMAFYKWVVDRLDDPFGDYEMPALFKSVFFRKGLIITISLFILTGLVFLYIPVSLYFK